MPDKITIPDTSCLIILAKVELLSALYRIYKDVRITEIIKNEYIEELPKWVKIEKSKISKQSLQLYSLLDKGEASAIEMGLYYGKQNTILILDDLKARKIAKRFDLVITGTLGIIHKAKEIGMINEIRPYLEKLKKYNFRIAGNIEEELLRMNNE